ncbi:MAG: helix-hairpin-helix domain-containing protein [Anaerolineaceae bacterium]
MTVGFKGIYFFSSVKMLSFSNFAMINWKTLALGVFIGLLSSGLILLVAKGPAYKSFELQPIPTTRPLVVHITGAVVSPGVYHVPVQSRISDLVEAAGGFSQEADLEVLNLSELVSDGQKITIPTINTDVPSKSSTQINRNESNGTDLVELININTATDSALSSLPGIGPVIAANIIEYRDTHGNFKSPEELMNVKGIGISSFEEIKDLITLR